MVKPIIMSELKAPHSLSTDLAFQEFSKQIYLQATKPGKLDTDRELARHRLEASNRELATHRLEALALGFFGGGAVVLAILSYNLGLLALQQPLLFGRTATQSFAAVAMGVIILLLVLGYEFFKQGQLRASRSEPVSN